MGGARGWEEWKLQWTHGRTGEERGCVAGAGCGWRVLPNTAFTRFFVRSPRFALSGTGKTPFPSPHPPPVPRRLHPQALKEASKEMKTAFKKNKELDIGYIENMQDEMIDMMVRRCARVCVHVLKSTRKTLRKDSVCDAAKRRCMRVCACACGCRLFVCVPLIGAGKRWAAPGGCQVQARGDYA